MYSTSPAAIVRIPEPGPTGNSIGDISGPVQDFESRSVYAHLFNLLIIMDLLP